MIVLVNDNTKKEGFSSPQVGRTRSNQPFRHSEKEKIFFLKLSGCSWSHYKYPPHSTQIPNNVPDDQISFTTQSWTSFIVLSLILPCQAQILPKLTILILWHLDLHPLDLDPPGPGGLVQDVLHQVADHLPLGQDLRQSLKRLELLSCSQKLYFPSCYITDKILGKIAQIVYSR